jgi:hypothetical protein
VGTVNLLKSQDREYKSGSRGPGFGSPQSGEVYRTKTLGGHAYLRKAISQKKFHRTSQRANIWGLR